MEEVFKDVDGWPGYRVSNLGRVQSCKGWKGMGYGRKPTIIYTKPWKELRYDVDKRGRHRVTFSHLGKTKRYWVHRLVLSVFVGPCPPTMECCHNDGDCSNNKLENLRWDTHQSNIDDKIIHQTNNPTRLHYPQGESHPMAKISNAQVLEIREKRRQGAFLKPLANEYGLTVASISLICLRKIWKHI